MFDLKFWRTFKLIKYKLISIRKKIMPTWQGKHLVPIKEIFYFITKKKN